jgi:YD repeat-containing protein
MKFQNLKDILKMRFISNLFSVVLIALCITPFASFGTEETYSVRIESNELDQSNHPSGYDIIIEDGRFSELGSPSFVDISEKLRVKFGVHERDYFGYIGNYGTLSTTVYITPINDNGTNATPLAPQTVSVSYTSNGSTGLDINTSTIKHSGFNKYKIHVDPIVGVPQNLYLEAELTIDRYYEIDPNVPALSSVGCNYVVYDPITGAETITYGIATGGDLPAVGEIEVWWDYIEGAEEYELEWTWIDNYSTNGLASFLPNSMSFDELEFERNNSRIITDKQSYRIPLIYAQGYLIYRVRGVGRWTDQVDLPKFGPWSTDGSTQTTVGSWPHYVRINTEHELLKNWQYQAVYAEEGKKKEIISYFDGSLRNRQTATRINSDNNTVVGESIYDNQGRAAIQILPAPVNNPALRYYQQLNLNMSLEPYSHLDFDWEDINTLCGTVVEGMHTNSGASKYYSTNNPWYDNWQDYVPHANNFPFVQTEYTPDNTGRIRRQSGVGDDYKIDGDHATQYFYLQPTQEELDRLFGYQVGFKSRYKKNLVVDANGQVSISYIDPQGRVIATALAGTNTMGGGVFKTNLESIEEESTTGIHIAVDEDLLNKIGINDFDTNLDDNETYISGNNGQEPDGLMLNTQFGSVDDNSPHDFTYKVKTTFFEECGLQYPFAYNLYIDITDDCGQSMILGGNLDENGVPSTLNPGAISQQINTSNVDNTYTFNALLDVGSYTITKRIEVDPVLLDQYAQDYLQHTTCLIPENQFLTNNVDCDDNGDLPQDLQPMDLNACNIAYQMMLADISPYGQYGEPTGTDPLSVFTLTNFLDKGNVSTTMNWQNPTVPYEDLNGQTDWIPVDPDLANLGQFIPDVAVTPTLIGGSYYVQPQDLSDVADFVANWKSSWGVSLVEYHPEYDYYTGCYGELCSSQWNSMSSEEYDGLLQLVDTYAAANSLTNPLGVNLTSANAIRDNDPYFNINYTFIQTAQNSYDGNTFKNELMTEVLTDYKRHLFPNQGLSMWDFAVKTVVCGADFSGACVIPFNYSDAGGRNLTGLSTPQQDQIWSIYKQTYIGEKKKINQVFIDAYGIANLCYNGYIGDDAPTNPSVTGFLHYMDYALPTKPILDAVITTPPFYPFYPASPLPAYPTSPVMIDFYMEAIAVAAGSSPSLLPWTLGPGTGLFSSKQKRFIPVDNLYDSAIPDNVMIAQGSSSSGVVDNSIYQNTGRCDLSFDVEYFLNAIGTHGFFNAIQSSPWVSSSQIPEMTADLYEAMGGTIVAPGMGGQDVKVKGVDNITNFEIYATDASGGAALSSIKINYPSGGTFAWTDIVGFETLYYIPTTNYDFEILAIVDNGGIIEEWVLTGSTNIQIGNCSYTPPCPKAEGIGYEFQILFDHLFQNNQLTSSFSEPIITNLATGWYDGSEIQAQLNDYSSNAVFSNNGLGEYKITNGSYEIKVNFGVYPSDILYASGASYNPVNGDLKLYYTNTQAQDVDLSGNPIFAQATVTFLDNLVPTNFDLGCNCDQQEEMNIAFEELFNYLLEEDSQGNLGAVIYSCSQLTNVSPYLIIPDPEIHYLFGPPNNYVTTPDRFGFKFDKTGECVIYFVHDGGSTGNLELLESVHNVQITQVGATIYIHCTGVLSNGSIVQLVASRVPCLIMPSCSECIPTALRPVSCNDKFIDYDNAVTSWNSTITDSDDHFVVFLTPAEFCDFSHAYVTDAYIHYITTTGVAASNQGADNDYYLTIAEFGNTVLGQGYVNNQNGSDLSDVVDAYNIYVGANGFISWGEYVNNIYVPSTPGACPQVPQPNPIEITVDIPCEQLTANVDIVNAQNQYDQYINNIVESFKERYIEEAVSTVIENFDVHHDDKEYHYTLYYYDQAGNLVQTVPPAGVDRIEQSEINQASIDNIRASAPQTGLSTNDPTIIPVEDLSTQYEYNSLNQLVFQNTPDGGESEFGYDELGRLVVSQNAKQKANTPYEQFSYTRYDGLGRIIEVGEMSITNGIDYGFNEDGKFVDNVGEVIDISSPYFPDYMNAVSNPYPITSGPVHTTREEVTKTQYDESISTAIEALFADYSKYNTRNRITGVMYYEDYASIDPITSYDNATFYDYDVHGNVKELIQDIQDANLLALGQNIKKTKYEYDLVSGNVKEVAYQDEEEDQFVHQYEYDGDNRITSMFTSKDREHWEQDAKYFYYEHGPLARKEVADKKVQAEDYAYTIQGWLKGVNSEDASRDNDQGKDGAGTHANRMNGKDVYGYSLHYFDGDYQSRTGTTDFMVYSNTVPLSPQKDLFNGNIKQMYTASSDLSEMYMGTNHTWYTYDQLNRIKAMEQEEFNSSGVIDASKSDYGATYIYDGNGNLKELTRKVSTSALASQNIDDFEYTYYPGTNRLKVVTDGLGASVLGTDLGTQGTPGSINYTYTEIGELKTDAQENIAEIKWKVTGKVDEILYADGSKIEFGYDAMGNRIYKRVVPDDQFEPITTFYIRDAPGNVMSIYTLKENDFMGGSYINNLYLTERNIYGSSRVGLENVEQVIASSSPGNVPSAMWLNSENTGIIDVQLVGDKRFELANHLGNVLQVVSDKKVRI